MGGGEEPHRSDIVDGIHCLGRDTGCARSGCALSGRFFELISNLLQFMEKELLLFFQELLVRAC